MFPQGIRLGTQQGRPAELIPPLALGAAGIMDQGEAAIHKVAILGALTLYLDFINLFLSLLQFLGNRRD